MKTSATMPGNGRQNFLQFLPQLCLRGPKESYPRGNQAGKWPSRPVSLVNKLVLEMVNFDQR